MLHNIDDPIPGTVDLLDRLIAFPTVSADPNIALIRFVAGLLERAGAEVTVIADDTGAKANLFATIGPRDVPGVMLSGHTDVVPVTGQDWSVPAFEMTEAEDRYYGRGTTDMKGFVASAVRTALTASRMDLATPLHLALSYDEEIGCVGVRSLIDMLAQAPVRPQLCIVGEPTGMQVATGHKGKTAARVTATGHAAHSALAPDALNAIHMACDMIGFIRALQQELAEEGARDTDYDVPYTTLHVGRIDGGVALNIVPDRAEFLFEIRNLAGDDPAALLARIDAYRVASLAKVRPDFPEADIEVEITNSYPPLNTDKGSDVARFVQSLVKSNATIKVAFGTEGGLFSNRLGVPTVVCGPGSMAQGHKPDEYISGDQLALCDTMLDALLERLQAGL
ncbi:MAG: acetylornithine deacetylase [Pseudomonadota bacterium]